MEQFWADWSDYESSLKPVRVLGRGSQGSVTLMGDHHLRGYAKKTSPVNLLDNLQKELHIMIRFNNHPCIIRAKSPVVHFENNRNGERFCYIYIEFANKGTLEKMIYEEFGGKPLPEYMVQRAARMILQGLEALHANGYVHCDIKPANLFLSHSATPGEPFDLKIADFGLSKLPNSDSISLNGSVGTPVYMSPESFWTNSPIEPARDIWSLGSVVSEMFGGKPQKQVLQGGYYDWFGVKDISPVAIDFLSRCHNSLSRRATAAELLNHPFITQQLSPPPRQQVDWTRIIKLPAGYIW